MTREDMLEAPIGGVYHRYLLPTIGGTIVTSIYVLADTIMIGKGLGAIPVAALNLILPLYSIFYGTGALFGVGGSVLYSVSMGKQDHQKAQNYLGISGICLLGVLLIYLGLAIGFKENVLTLLGAEGPLREYATGYYEAMVFGIFFFGISNFLQAFIRSDQNPTLAMVGVIAGGITNIILDYVFIFILHMGMKGAALATVIGAGVTCLLLCSHFLRKDNHLHPRLGGDWHRQLGQVLEGGFASFLGELAPGVVIFVMNYQILRYMGEAGVVVYSILANVAIIVLSLVNGCSQAVVPILSINYGAGHWKRIQKASYLGGVYSCVIGVLFLLLGWGIPDVFTYMFVYPNEEILELARGAIRLYFIAFPLMGLGIFMSSYYQSILQGGRAFFLSLCRGFLMCIPTIFILPILLGDIGIWLAIPLGELFSLGILLGGGQVQCMLRKNKGKM